MLDAQWTGYKHVRDLWVTNPCPANWRRLVFAWAAYDVAFQCEHSGKELGHTGMTYAVGATALGAGFMFMGASAARDLTDARARRLFFASLLYHPLLLGFMLFDTVRV